MQMPEPDIESIERAIATLSNKDDLELTIPSPALGVTAFCAEAALLQFIVTWSRATSNEGTVVFSSLDARSEALQTQLRRQLGIPYFVAAWVLAGRLRDGHHELLKRLEAKGYADFLDAMDAFEFSDTHDTPESRANLVCVQGGKREFIRPFYESHKGSWRVKREGDIRVVIQDILVNLAPHWSGRYLREVSESLAHLVRELVENSDWWARVDHRGVEYAKGIRAVTCRLVDIDNDNLPLFAGQNTHLHSYLQHSLMGHERSREEPPSSNPNIVRRLNFLELSMVDSGPGLARRWLANRPENKQSVERLDEISLIEEENAVIECFKKWKTSSGNTLRGVGLFSIASLLRKRQGFLRLRTGRLGFLFGTPSAIKDVETKLMLHTQLSEYVKLEDGTHVFLQGGKMIFFLRPWSNEKLAPVEGTAYSILLPV